MLFRSVVFFLDILASIFCKNLPSCSCPVLSGFVDLKPVFVSVCFTSYLVTKPVPSTKHQFTERTVYRGECVCVCSANKHSTNTPPHLRLHGLMTCERTHTHVHAFDHRHLFLCSSGYIRGLLIVNTQLAQILTSE